MDIMDRQTDRQTDVTSSVLILQTFLTCLNGGKLADFKKIFYKKRRDRKECFECLAKGKSLFKVFFSNRVDCFRNYLKKIFSEQDDLFSFNKLLF